MGKNPFVPYYFTIPTLPRDVWIALAEIQKVLAVGQHRAVCVALLVTRDLLQDGQEDAVRKRLTPS